MTPTLSQRAEEIEHRQLQELGERIVAKSQLYRLADGERGPPAGFGQADGKRGNDNTPASHMWRTLRRRSNAL